MEINRALADSIMGNSVMGGLVATSFRKVIGAKRWKNKAYLTFIKADLNRLFDGDIFSDDGRARAGFRLFESGCPFGEGTDKIGLDFRLELHDEMRIDPQVIEYMAIYERFVREFFIRQDLVVIGITSQRLRLHHLTPSMVVCSMYA